MSTFDLLIKEVNKRDEEIARLIKIITEAGQYLDMGESGDAMKTLYNGLGVNYDYFEKLNEEEDRRFEEINRQRIIERAKEISGSGQVENPSSANETINKLRGKE